MTFRKVKGRGVPEWLYTRHLKGSVQFWIRYRKTGIQILENLSKLPGVDGQKKAVDAGTQILAQALSAGKNQDKESVLRCETIVDEVVHLKRGKAKRTYLRNESIARVHIKPYLNAFCPYVKDFNAATWEHYKVYKRAENPNVTLFGHWKFFVSMGSLLFQKGIKRERIKFAFNELKEDFRKAGQVIPDEYLRLMLKHSTDVWRDRIWLQRLTGMRPGEVSGLRKDRVDFDALKIVLRKEDTKTRKARTFAIAPQAAAILRRRAESAQGEFFFPGRDDASKPIDASLKYWKRAIARANKELREAGKKPMPSDYTPHDLRHTYLTHEFRRPNAQASVICWMCGLTLEEAQKTYLHFTVEDTREIAERLAKESLALDVAQ